MTARRETHQEGRGRWIAAADRVVAGFERNRRRRRVGVERDCAQQGVEAVAHRTLERAVEPGVVGLPDRVPELQAGLRGWRVCRGVLRALDVEPGLVAD